MLGDEKISFDANRFFFFNFYDLAHWSEIRQVNSSWATSVGLFGPRSMKHHCSDRSTEY